jgi:hypothetical protein
MATPYGAGEIGEIGETGGDLRRFERSICRSVQSPQSLPISLLSFNLLKLPIPVTIQPQKAFLSTDSTDTQIINDSSVKSVESVGKPE